MKSVLGPYAGLQKLLDTPRFDEASQYVGSRYRIDVDCADGQLLYNTFTGELVLLDPGETCDSLREELVERHFLVPSDLDEHAQVKQIKQLLRMMQPPARALTSFTILTTTDCNARCPYCYEHGIARKTMSGQVAHDVAAYIADHCGGERVSIHWFGGEPLCNVEAIDIISQELAGRGVSFSSHMTSNGFYLDSQVAARAKHSWNLDNVQITIDGTEDTYNKVKGFIDADGSSYERVLANIGQALDCGIRIIVRLNMDESNADDLLRLCDELAERFSGRGGIRVVVIPLVSLAGGVHEFASDEEKVRGYIRINERLEARGLVSYQPLPRVLSMNRCMADGRKCEVILPDGQVARCEHFDETEHIGDIYSPERDARVVASWEKRDESIPECRDCPLWPTCIPLERCAWDRAGCTEARRELRLYRFKKRILAEYERSKGAAR